jgi:hypothetical protein
VGGFNFIAISSLTLQNDEHTDPWAYNDTWTFINALSDAAKDGDLDDLGNVNLHPRILLSHVPFWRPADTYCGRYNGHGPLVEREGYSYTNMLPQETTRVLIDKIKPIHIFSGGDHDQCEYYHEEGVVEVSH